MANEIRHGFQINPLTLWVAGGLGAALYGLQLSIVLSIRDRQDTMQQSVTTLVTSQSYDRKELDNVKSDVKQVQEDMRGLTDRLGKVEARK